MSVADVGGKLLNVKRKSSRSDVAGRKSLPRKASDLSKEELLLTLQKKRECNAKALKIVEGLLESNISETWFLDALQHINQSHLQDVVEERSIIKLCGYPLCSNVLKNVPSQQYCISTRNNKVYDISERKSFCSNLCFRSCRFLKDQMHTSPLWLRDIEKKVNFKLIPCSEVSCGAGDEVNVGPERVTKEELYQDRNEARRPDDCHLASPCTAASDTVSTTVKSLEMLYLSQIENPPPVLLSTSKKTELSMVDLGQNCRGKQKDVPDHISDNPCKTEAERETSTSADNNMAENMLAISGTTSHNEQNRGPYSSCIEDSRHKTKSASNVHNCEESCLTCTSLQKCLIFPDCKVSDYRQKTPNFKTVSVLESCVKTKESNGNSEKNSPFQVELQYKSTGHRKQRTEVSNFFSPCSSSKCDVEIVDSDCSSNSNVLPVVDHEVSSDSPLTIGDGNQVLFSGHQKEGWELGTKLICINQNVGLAAQTVSVPHLEESCAKHSGNTSVSSDDCIKSNHQHSLVRNVLKNHGKTSAVGVLPLVCNVEKSVQEWFSLETMCFLYGENVLKCMLEGKSNSIKNCFKALRAATWDSEKHERFLAICKRLSLMEMEDNGFDHQVRKEDPVSQRKPLPDYNALKKEAEVMDLKVQAFYGGKLEIDERKVTFAEDTKRDEAEDSEQGDKSLQVPLLHLHSQRALRKRIVLDGLNRVLPDFFRTFGIRTSEMASSVRGLVGTFSLSPSNITFKPQEWSLIGLIVVKLLSLREPVLRSYLETDQSQTYLTLMLMSFKLEPGYLDRLLIWLTDIDKLLPKYEISSTHSSV